jgi:hypothetical protein
MPHWVPCLMPTQSWTLLPLSQPLLWLAAVLHCQVLQTWWTVGRRSRQSWSTSGGTLWAELLPKSNLPCDMLRLNLLIYGFKYLFLFLALRKLAADFMKSKSKKESFFEFEV